MEEKRPTVKKRRAGKAAPETNHGGAAGSGPPVRIRPDGVPVLTPTPTRRAILPIQ